MQSDSNGAPQGQTLRRSQKTFQDIEKIGSGAYGTVYKAKWNATGTFVALKVVPLHVEQEGVPSSALREISLLRELQHPCVVSLLDIQYATASNELYLVFECMHQDLRKHFGERLQAGQTLSPQTVKSFLYQLLCAIAFCHSHRIMHRDLKPENVLLDKHGNIKLADFGLARVFTMPLRRYTNGVVTLWYRSPELLMGESQYVTAVDVWSMGCIMYELATLRVLFEGMTEIDQLFKIFRLVGTPDESTWQGVKHLPDYNDKFPKWPAQNMAAYASKSFNSQGQELFESMMYCEPSQRISCAQALNHPYFEDIDAETRKLSTY